MLHFVLVSLASLASLAYAAPAVASAPPIPVTPWLVAGPIDRGVPALAADAKTIFDDLLAADDFDRARLDPEEGDAFAAGIAPDQRVEWTRRETAILASGEQPRLAFVAARITTDRYVEAKLEVTTYQRCRVFLDGEQVAEKTKIEGNDAPAAGTVSADLCLEPGTHRLLVKAVFDPAGPDDWSVGATLAPKEEFQGAAISTALLPTRAVTVDDMLDVAAVSSIALSPRGDLLAVLMRRPEVPADFAKRWVEIRDAKDMRVLFTSESLADLADFQWLPDGTAFSYVTKDGDKSTLWKREVNGAASGTNSGANSGAARPVLRDVLKLASYRWLPGSAGALVFTAAKEEKADDRGVKRMRGLADRWPGQRDVAHLWLADTDAMGLKTELVAGDISVNLQDVRKDGAALLFTRTRQDVAERPYAITELHELDLATREAKRLIESKSLGGAVYTGRGDEIVAIGGPSNLAPGVSVQGIPNDYQTLLYAFDRSGGSLSPLLPGLAPSIEEVAVATAGGALFARLEDGIGVAVVQIDLAANPVTARSLALPFQVAAGLSVAEDGSRLAAYGSSARDPQRITTLDLMAAPPAATTLALEDDRFRRVGFGEVRRFDVKLDSNEVNSVIEGYVHLPRGFDPAKRYPAIVFYYGGTSPIAFEFGGRYPRDLWAAHGYVCYSLTPSGATGRGVEFATRHVNDWGERTCAEVLSCVDSFLASHPFVDGARLGCIGASYGGFMTLSLLTKTSRFKAAVSHAGISSLASYWGEGFWGYQYSAIASAESFPWNSRGLYVDKSPLFNADKVTTSLLLTHGEADTNVPIGESEQMYTALKLLGKDVEFLKFAGQNHHILQYPVRKLWMKSIVAWFDWKLKEEPGWWKKLYPK